MGMFKNTLKVAFITGVCMIGVTKCNEFLSDADGSTPDRNNPDKEFNYKADPDSCTTQKRKQELDCLLRGYDGKAQGPITDSPGQR